MIEKKYHYSWAYKINFLPGILTFVFFIYLVSLSGSPSRIYGYIAFGSGLIFHLRSNFKERKKVAKEIVLTESGIVAKHNFKGELLIEWSNIESMSKERADFEMRHWKLQKTNVYGVITSKDNKKIIFRKEIINYDELIRLIETKTGNVFENRFLN